MRPVIQIVAETTAYFSMSAPVKRGERQAHGHGCVAKFHYLETLPSIVVPRLPGFVLIFIVVRSAGLRLYRRPSTDAIGLAEQATTMLRPLPWTFTACG